jgi:hypothetical protein
MARTTIQIQPPLAGVDRAYAFQSQPPFTLSDANNVRGRSVFDQRAILGSRPGLVKAFAQNVSMAGGSEVESFTEHFFAAKDVTLVGLDPNGNYDGTTSTRSLRMGCGPTGLANDKRRFLMHFDMTDIPASATITAASLYLRCWFTESDGPAKIYRVTQTSWVEAQATWNSYATSLTWATAGLGTSDYTTTGQLDFTKPVDVGDFTISGLAALAQTAYDSVSKQLHLVFVSTDETTTNTDCGFRQSEYTADSSHVPKLTVSYTVPA